MYNLLGAVKKDKMRLWHFMRCCSANTIFLNAATELIVQVDAIKTVYFPRLKLLMNSILFGADTKV
jgi:hypothetical protein